MLLVLKDAVNSRWRRDKSLFSIWQNLTYSYDQSNKQLKPQLKRKSKFLWFCFTRSPFLLASCLLPEHIASCAWRVRFHLNTMPHFPQRNGRPCPCSAHLCARSSFALRVSLPHVRHVTPSSFNSFRYSPFRPGHSSRDSCTHAANERSLWQG